MQTTESPRYTLERTAPGTYKAIDLRFGIFVTFEEGRFEETQRWSNPTDSQIPPHKLNQICDGIEGWLNWRHRGIMGLEEKYKVVISEDGSTVTFIRPGTPGVISDPHIEITFPAELYKKTAAAKISGMAKFLRDQAPDWHSGNF